MTTSHHKENFQEHRQGPDFLVYWIRISSFVVWLILGSFLVITDFAKPQQTTFFDRLLDVSRRSVWDEHLLFMAFISAVVLFFFSLLSLIINSMRLKRKNDHVSISLIISLIISSLSILAYLAYTLNNMYLLASIH